jgi:FixJ family two-component response regulator
MLFSIYYLDDEVELLDIFIDVFAAKDREIKAFSDPIEFINAVKMKPPNLIFLDFRLPRTTGDEVASKIDFSIPKVLITGDIDVNVKSNFISILGKPIKFDLVEALISSQQAKLNNA